MSARVISEAAYKSALFFLFFNAAVGVPKGVRRPTAGRRVGTAVGFALEAAL